MKNLSHKSSIIVFSLIFAVIFYRWFTVGQIIGGDWPFLFDEYLKGYSLPVSSWNTWFGNGLGGVTLAFSLQIFNNFTTSLAYFFNIPWVVVYKIFWFGLFIFLSIASSIYLVNLISPKLNIWQKLTASLVFSTNTYILMVVGGGQMGVALSYAVAPLVLSVFIKLIDLISSSYSNYKFRASNYKWSLISGLALSLQVMFDPRIAYLTMFAVALYVIFNLKRNMINALYLILYTFIIPGLVAVLLHAEWILPILISKQSYLSDLSSASISVGIVKFLSFATFSQSFSFLHPNWPENIFGKVSFMKPEFLVLPTIAYLSLFFIGKDKINLKILFFALLGIIGAFLTKGANPPFGGIYLWLFDNVPGFVMFRDPTKFYVLIALSYSVLISFSISKLTEKVSSIKYQVLSIKINNFSYIVPIAFIIFWIISIHPAILGQLGGTFKQHDVSKEYVELKDFLYKQPDFFRTLWVPRQQRFSFFSEVHPSVEAEPLFGTRSAEALSKKISSEQGQLLLSELSVKYVLIQYDSLGEQFLDDRKYSEEQRREYENKFDTIPWLKKIQSGKITVYETPFNQDHFFLDGAGKVSATMISPTHYILTVSIDQPQNLIFSENFSPYWILTKSQKDIFSKKTKNGLNSFWLDQKGKYTVDISFSLERYYEYGRIISFLTMITLMMCIIKLRKK